VLDSHALSRSQYRPKEAQMTRRLLICLSALAAAALVAPSAWAEKPTIERFVDDSSYEGGEDVCGFLLQFDLDLNLRVATFSDGRTLTNVRGTWQLANALTGESATFRIAGSVRGTQLPNGDFREDVRGQFLLFYFPGDQGGPGIFYTKGRTVDIYDATTGFIKSTRFTGQRTDVCALLS
jgi:hypothetical protein